MNIVNDCSPFKLAEAGSRRFLERDKSTCEAEGVWGGSQYTVLGHVKDALKTCAQQWPIREMVKSSKWIPRHLGANLDFYVTLGDVTGSNFQGLEAVFAARELIFYPYDDSNFTTTVRLRPGGTGTVTPVVDGKTQPTRAITYRIDRTAGVALELRYTDDGSTKRYVGRASPANPLEFGGFDGIAGEVGNSDLCMARVTCPKSGDEPCRAK